LFRGEIQEGKNASHVKNTLASIFKRDLTQIEQLFTGQPIVLQEHVSHDVAVRYQQAFQQAGAICYIQPQTKASPPESAGSRNSGHHQQPNARPRHAASRQNLVSRASAQPAFSLQETSNNKELKNLLASYKAKNRQEDCVFISPNIPEIQLENAQNLYAYSFRPVREKALVLLDLINAGKGMLLSETKLYVYEQHPPLRHIQANRNPIGMP
jgi:hypothetical protein